MARTGFVLPALVTTMSSLRRARVDHRLGWGRSGDGHDESSVRPWSVLCAPIVPDPMEIHFIPDQDVSYRFDLIVDLALAIASWDWLAALISENIRGLMAGSLDDLETVPR